MRHRPASADEGTGGELTAAKPIPLARIRTLTVGRLLAEKLPFFAASAAFSVIDRDCPIAGRSGQVTRDSAAGESLQERSSSFTWPIFGRLFVR